MFAKKMSQNSNYHGSGAFGRSLNITRQTADPSGKVRVVINGEGNVKIGVAKTPLLRCLTHIGRCQLKISQARSKLRRVPKTTDLIKVKCDV